jgi:hypothetical protein|eukprot:COSAG06_NODE_5407_length_3501_cov_315.154615_5_plen_57_part_00
MVTVAGSTALRMVQQRGTGVSVVLPFERTLTCHQARVKAALSVWVGNKSSWLLKDE